MGVTAPGALPYPEPADPVAAGADNIKALAQAIDPKLVHVFTSIADRDAKWPAPPNGAFCQAPAGTFYVRAGGVWVRDGYHRFYSEAETILAYIDQFTTYSLHDGSPSWPVPSVCRITVNTGITGWIAGVVPRADIYTNDIGSPFPGGGGFIYCACQGTGFTAAQVGGQNAVPQFLPSMSAVEKVPAGNAPTFIVRVVAHNAPGAIPVNLMYHAILERIPLIP